MKTEQDKSLLDKRQKILGQYQKFESKALSYLESMAPVLLIDLLLDDGILFLSKDKIFFTDADFKVLENPFEAIYQLHDFFRKDDKNTQVVTAKEKIFENLERICFKTEDFLYLKNELNIYFEKKDLQSQVDKNLNPAISLLRL